ncbi:hypothetical protein PAMP_002792 [Pampus punctatissimus]
MTSRRRDGEGFNGILTTGWMGIYVAPTEVEEEKSRLPFFWEIEGAGRRLSFLQDYKPKIEPADYRDEMSSENLP